MALFSHTMLPEEACLHMSLPANGLLLTTHHSCHGLERPPRPVWAGPCPPGGNGRDEPALPRALLGRRDGIARQPLSLLQPRAGPLPPVRPRGYSGRPEPLCLSVQPP